jgi:hypothetical protein
MERNDSQWPGLLISVGARKDLLAEKAYPRRVISAIVPNPAADSDAPSAFLGPRRNVLLLPPFPRRHRRDIHAQAEPLLPCICFNESQC